MSILIIGVGEIGAKIAGKINQEKISGVNCAVVVNSIEPEYPSITKGVNIWDGEMRQSVDRSELAKRLAVDSQELIKSLIIEGTSNDWSLETE
ncbi:MAG: hypothetical protein Q7U47_04730 [Paludibacter sp.]|nr:hypothetical protein [Paludibacter sp.]